MYIDCLHFNFFFSYCQELIDLMLTVDPKRRVTAADALKHKWISVSINFLSFWTEKKAVLSAI